MIDNDKKPMRKPRVKKNTETKGKKTGSKAAASSSAEKTFKPRTDDKPSSTPRTRTGDKPTSGPRTRTGDKPTPSTKVCPVQRRCGGCQLIHLPYKEQLHIKQREADALLSKFCKPEPIIGMEDPFHYRFKVHAVFDHGIKGMPISGVYEANSHKVVPIETCMIEHKKADAIIGSIRGMLKSFKIKTYDEDTEYGLFRHVLIRIGKASGQIMVVIVLASQILPSKNNFVKALLKEHPEITTIILNVNDKHTSMVLGDRNITLYGKGFIEDTLCGKKFKISPNSFYQVNPIQTEVLYGKAMEFADLNGSETVIDAYCGTGTIGLIASDHAKSVIGVELNKEAYHDAVQNARLNGVTNTEFYNNDAGVFMNNMAQNGHKADVVFMDPPRSGSDDQFLDAVVSLDPKKVIYVSCNPKTLARDLEYITGKGYKAQKITLIDMFPCTDDIEAVVLLTRIKVNK